LHAVGHAYVGISQCIAFASSGEVSRHVNGLLREAFAESSPIMKIGAVESTIENKI
jgi:hypothetical protein